MFFLGHIGRLSARFVCSFIFLVADLFFHSKYARFGQLSEPVCP